jgi:hypothetical protein
MFGLASENAHWECPRTLGGRVNQRLGIYVDDVDAVFERCRRAGAKIAYEPHDQHYGDQVFECIDPEGHRWKFHQVMEEVDHTTLQRPKDRVPASQTGMTQSAAGAGETISDCGCRDGRGVAGCRRRGPHARGAGDGCR